MFRIVTDTTSGLPPDLAEQYNIPIAPQIIIFGEEEYLQKGGRIGGASAFVGSIIKMRPILALIDGQVEPVERQRTHRRALQTLKELVVTESAQGEEAQLSIMHAECLEIAKALAADLLRSLDKPDVISMDLVPAIVTHAGPGAPAVGFIAAEES